MNKDIVGLVDKCLNCQQVKSKHQRHEVLSQDIDTPTWKWVDVNMHFVWVFPRTRMNRILVGLLLIESPNSPSLLPSRLHFWWKTMVNCTSKKL